MSVLPPNVNIPGLPPGAKVEMIEIKNLMLGALAYNGYAIRLFTAGDWSLKRPIDQHIILTKDSDKYNIHSMARISIATPEYIDLGPHVEPFYLDATEAKDLYDLLNGKNFDSTFPLFAQEFVNPNLTLFQNYIMFLNAAHNEDEAWKELDIEMPVPKYRANMMVRKPGT